MQRLACALLALACLGSVRSVARADLGGADADDAAPNDATRASRALTPRGPSARVQPGFAELYGDPGLVPTLGEEQARWVVATSGELARTLTTMHGVVDARVHLATPNAPSTLDVPRAAASASVLVTREAGRPPIDERAVRALVSGAVEGLAPERVTIVQEEAPATRGPRLVALGPLRITADSFGALKLVLGGALAGNAALAIALAALVARRRRRFARS